MAPSFPTPLLPRVMARLLSALGRTSRHPHRHLRHASSAVPSVPPYASSAARVYLHATNLCDNPGARQRKNRVGRGEGSGRGKHSGRGHKGWLARSNRALPHRGYEGGQTGIVKALPKFGKRPLNREQLVHVHLDKLQHWIDAGRIDATRPIGIKEMYEAKLIGGIKDGVVLLANGAENFKSRITIYVSRASKLAIERVEALGGKITCVYLDERALHAARHPHKYFVMPSLPALPSTDRDIARYASPLYRGYLATRDGASLSIPRIISTQRKLVP
ncbi:hypothetical protein SeMB42_g04933 [Synchytrium endobioticum]|uniref:Large ribosomal subunit protein uL15/eL18 domain-containing protein n=1 Tax=Synchytrium endobioticum TaxID=286115 RepID=A0A507D418_9FUNG|nr:hypothetical protein SeMB42_g04933 [Synchytrium endobioticum]TPX46067.1 hypothetical protein SeLEV6574_g03440 [Synchytrium endobioticum]